MVAPAVAGAGAAVAPVLASAVAPVAASAAEVGKAMVKAPGRKFPETYPIRANVPLGRQLTKEEVKLLKRAINVDLFRDMTRNPVVQVLTLYVITEGLQKLDLLGDVAGNVVEGAGLTAIGLNQLSHMSGLAQAVGVATGALAGGAYGLSEALGGNGNRGTTWIDVFKYFTGWISPFW